MKHHVSQFVLSCDACQKNKTVHKKPLGQPTMVDVPNEPWEHISIDFCGPFPKTKNGHDYVCAIVCNLIRAVILLPCKKEISALDTAKLFVQKVLPRVGLPKIITSDRGPQFVSNFWGHVWAALGTKVALTAPFHPQSNSLIERQNKTFIESLRAFVNARQNDWDEHLVIYEFAFNNSVNDSTGETPFFLNHGRHPTLPALVNHPNQSSVATDFVNNLKTSIIEARDHVIRSRAARADERVTDLTPHTFQVGDKVLLSTANYNLKLPSQKLAPRFIGPLKVLEIRGPNTVKIEVPPRLQAIQPLQNISHLRPYHERPAEIGPPPVTQDPELIDGEEEFEVEDILAHRNTGNKIQYLVRFATYGPEDDLWLPARILANAQNTLEAYWKRQNDEPPVPRTRQRAQRHLTRLGHILW